MADNPFLKDRWAPPPSAQTLASGVATENPFLTTGKVAMDAASKVKGTAKDAAWNLYAGVMEGGLKTPGALAGDLPWWLINKGEGVIDAIQKDGTTPIADAIRLMTGGKPIQRDVDYSRNPFGSQSVRTMEKDLLGINEPEAPKTNVGRYARAGGELSLIHI